MSSEQAKLTSCDSLLQKYKNKETLEKELDEALEKVYTELDEKWGETEEWTDWNEMFKKHGGEKMKEYEGLMESVYTCLFTQGDTKQALTTGLAAGVPVAVGGGIVTGALGFKYLPKLLLNFFSS